jgi:hypothetical protein
MPNHSHENLEILVMAKKKETQKNDIFNEKFQVPVQVFVVLEVKHI